MKRSLLGAPSPRGAAVIRLRGGVGVGVWPAAIGALLSLLVVGCAGSLDPGVGGGGGGGGGTPCQETIFAAKCNFCHGTASQSAALDLQSADPGARLRDHMTSPLDSCPDGILLDANSNPATGVFIDKISNAMPACGGSRMPIGGTLSATELTCLTTWATTVTTGSP